MLLQTKTDIGKFRDKNEDFIAVSRHPKDDEIVFLCLADGMGGGIHGDVASETVVRALYNFFMESDVSLYEDIDLLKKKTQEVIDSCDELLISKFGENVIGTTLCMGYVLKDKTLIINIGDSRCYKYEDNKLEQVTEDDSEVYRLYKNGSVEKSELKYFGINNIITKCIGLRHELCECSYYEIDNSYDMLLFFSDGVTDLLSDEEIEEIINQSDKPKLLENIIDRAVNSTDNIEIPKHLKEKYDYLVEPFYGKDNASGIVFVK